MIMYLLDGHMIVRDEGGNDMLPAGDDDTCIIQDTDPDGECSDGGRNIFFFWKYLGCAILFQKLKCNKVFQI